ncbi:MAG: metallophosphoesterase, partial [Flavisolibacter sp.]
MKILSVLLFCLFGVTTSFAQIDSINQRIFLIGDAGEMHGITHPIVAWLKKNADWNDTKNTVLYLGDNIYPLGMPMVGEPTYEEAKRVLDDQISLVKGKKGRAIFIPGNHDWKNGKLGGWQQIMNEVNYINSLEQKNIQAWPLNGCPGPVPLELTDKIVLAIIDTQWFLFLHDKPGPGSNCDAKTIDEFQTELDEIVNSHKNQLLIVAMHHPIYSYGPHGGDYTLKEHIFPFTAVSPKLYIPLPILGSLYPLARGVFGSIQDIPHPLYLTMSKTILEEVKKHPNPIVVSGHDHGLQFIKRDSIPYIISGAGSVLTKLKPGRFSVFNDVEVGFSMIEVFKSGKVDVKYYNVNSLDLDHPTFTNQLKTLAPLPAAQVDTSRTILDSVVIVAASNDLKGTGIQRFLIGENYRKEWSQRIRVPVLDMGTEDGGLKPIKQTGGIQSRTLRVQDTTGREWALRFVIKYPKTAIPPDLLLTPAETSIPDGISASYPFGALSMGVLSNAAGVPYLNDKLVYLPDDPRLTRFRSTFKNHMALMEERIPVGIKTADNTEEMIVKLLKDNNNHIDQKAVLRARLLDNFVMDFDRHEAQWQWTSTDTGKVKYYFPIPVDRDYVFFTNQGLLPKLVRKPWLVPELQGFQAKALNIKTFNRSVRHFDRSFLTELTEEDWNKLIDEFLFSMSDSIIQKALEQQPIELHNQDMQQIIATLKKRRNYFKDEMLEYYRFISRKVSVVGSDQKEQFTINKKADGTVQVLINKIIGDSSLGEVIYNRTFIRDETREIMIF